MAMFLHVNKGRRSGEEAYVVHWTDDTGKSQKTRLLRVNGRLRHNCGRFMPRPVFISATRAIDAKDFGKKARKKQPWWQEYFSDAMKHQRACEGAGACEKWEE